MEEAGIRQKAVRMARDSRLRDGAGEVAIFGHQLARQALSSEEEAWGGLRQTGQCGSAEPGWGLADRVSKWTPVSREHCFHLARVEWSLRSHTHTSIQGAPHEMWRTREGRCLEWRLVSPLPSSLTLNHEVQGCSMFTWAAELSL